VKTSRKIMLLLALAITALPTGGCVRWMTGEDSYQGSMYTQSGERVSVYKEAYSGKEYYYDRGSKIYVNVGGPTRSPDRPTSWYGDR
jgi:flagellar basal body-associated protein FliL